MLEYGQLIKFDPERLAESLRPPGEDLKDMLYCPTARLGEATRIDQR
jgi:hypothetical protein